MIASFGEKTPDTPVMKSVRVARTRIVTIVATEADCHTIYSVVDPCYGAMSFSILYKRKALLMVRGVYPTLHRCSSIQQSIQ